MPVSDSEFAGVVEFVVDESWARGIDDISRSWESGRALLKGFSVAEEGGVWDMRSEEHSCEEAKLDGCGGLAEAVEVESGSEMGGCDAGSSVGNTLSCV